MLLNTIVHKRFDPSNSGNQNIQAQYNANGYDGTYQQFEQNSAQASYVQQMQSVPAQQYAFQQPVQNASQMQPMTNYSQPVSTTQNLQQMLMTQTLDNSQMNTSSPAQYANSTINGQYIPQQSMMTATQTPQYAQVVQQTPIMQAQNSSIPMTQTPQYAQVAQQTPIMQAQNSSIPMTQTPQYAQVVQQTPMAQIQSQVAPQQLATPSYSGFQSISSAQAFTGQSNSTGSGNIMDQLSSLSGSGLNVSIQRSTVNSDVRELRIDNDLTIHMDANKIVALSFGQDYVKIPTLAGIPNNNMIKPGGKYFISAQDVISYGSDGYKVIFIQANGCRRIIAFDPRDTRLIGIIDPAAGTIVAATPNYLYYASGNTVTTFVCRSADNKLTPIQPKDTVTIDGSLSASGPGFYIEASSQLGGVQKGMSFCLGTTKKPIVVISSLSDNHGPVTLLSETNKNPIAFACQ